MTRLLLIVSIMLLGVACGKPDPEVGAQAMLREARTQLAARQYDEARTTIDTMRVRYRRAIQARREALVLSDSINMLAAEDSLAFCADEQIPEMRRRAEFYRRKLQRDATQRLNN